MSFDNNSCIEILLNVDILSFFQKVLCLKERWLYSTRFWATSITELVAIIHSSYYYGLSFTVELILLHFDSKNLLQ